MNRYEDEPEIAARLSQRLDAVPGLAAAVAEENERTFERLKALGYTE